MSDSSIEVFSFMMTRFNVTRAKELVEEGKAKLVRVDPQDFKSVVGFIHVDKDDIAQANISEPGIMVKFAVPQAGAPDEVFTVVISGWPKVRKMLDGKFPGELEMHYFDDPYFVMKEIGWMRRPLYMGDTSNELIDDFEERVGGCGYPG